MDPHLREAWTRIVRGEDLDAHMAAIGQAQANAGLVAAMIGGGPPPSDSTVLFVGAGTGQMFDYVDPGCFASNRLTFTDINSSFLERLRQRLAGTDLEYETVVDDIECPRVRGPFGTAIVVLVLEHVEWKRALDGLTGLAPELLHIIVQRNPTDLAAAITPGRVLPPSIETASKTAHATLVDPIDIEAYLTGHAYDLVARCDQPVPDAKTMIGLSFRKRRDAVAAAAR